MIVSAELGMDWLCCVPLIEMSIEVKTLCLFVPHFLPSLCISFECLLSAKIRIICSAFYVTQLDSLIQNYAMLKEKKYLKLAW